MLGSDLRCVLFAHEQAADDADAVLLDSYQKTTQCFTFHQESTHD